MSSQLVASRRNSVFYYSSGNKLELDFLIQHGTEIVPIEAKAEENLRSKSLASFVSSHPGMHGIRFSMSDYREQEWMTNIPLYAVSVYFSINYAHDALCGLAMTKSSDEELLDGYLQDKYGK